MGRLKLDVQYAKAICEVNEYLKGINKEDIAKIPKNFIQFLSQNASKDYVCEFDYTKPLNELQLLEETKIIICLICYKYWCDTEEKKEMFLEQLNINEEEFQKELHEKYNVDNIFKNKVQIPTSKALVVKKEESILIKILNKIKNLFKLKKGD